ncbi:MAG TPA: nuclear transport factor 2 family protein [Pyrinomonadaceae bacterium]|nr:nuclear transport factor 2 family protein [Pyrinomonadaceae bacterium]
MSEQENVRLVEAAYAAFQRGDIPGVLANFTEDADWETPGTPEAIPHAGRKRGHEEMKQFFSTLAATENITHFEPREFIAKDDKVVVLGNYKGTVRGTGRNYDIDWLHVFTARDGKLSGFREFLDTAALGDAHRNAAAQTA